MSRSWTRRRRKRSLVPHSFGKLFRFTVELLNDHTDGFYDDIFDNDGTIIDWTVSNSACDATTTVRAFWNLRETRGENPNALIGCRCSSASISLARTSGLMKVPQISPESTHSALSDKEEFPYFSRLSSSKEAQALVSLLRHFGWKKVSIIHTEKQYSADLAKEFQRLWKGTHVDATGSWTGSIPYISTIATNENDVADIDSIRLALSDFPTEQSRVVLLLGHSQHAFAVLEEAVNMQFQPDTIWVGSVAWTNRFPSVKTPMLPGYIGVTPYRNRDGVYMDYLGRLQKWQQAQGRDPWPQLPDYAAEYMIDSILAAVLALSSLSEDERLNGDAVVQAIRGLNFSGVSGPVAFTEKGDRKDPKFSIFNLQEHESGLVWENLGSDATGDGTVDADPDHFCFPSVGCDFDAIPLDSYPANLDPVHKAITVGIPSILAILMLVLWRYCRSKAKKRRLKSNMSEMQKRLKAMKEIDTDLHDIDEMVEAAKKRQAELIERRAALQDAPKTWSNDIRTLVEVPPDDKQYWAVLDRMRETMPGVHISKLWRVQNTSLWAYYSFHKERLSMHKIAHGERQVWHGTSTLDPSVIYDDEQDGFMRQFAAQGYWGRGIYFAESACYAHMYAHRQHKEVAYPLVRDDWKEDESELILAKLLVGKEIFLDREESPEKAAEYSRLTVPPTDPKTHLKYNTVSGKTGGSKVYVVYENGRAYPDYVVRYYVGPRDCTRSPFESKEHATHNCSERLMSVTLEVAETGGPDVQVVWEFEGGDGWLPYDDAHQVLLEDHYQAFQDDLVDSSTIPIDTGYWLYAVDVENMFQTNQEHPNRRRRAVRRRELSL